MHPLLNQELARKIHQAVSPALCFFQFIEKKLLTIVLDFLTSVVTLVDFVLNKKITNEFYHFFYFKHLK